MKQPKEEEEEIPVMTKESNQMTTARDDSDSGDMDVLADARSESPTPAGEGRTSRVLFIDDDHRLLESLRIVLRNEPYAVVTAETIEQAERILVRQRVDVVVCDERMPTTLGTTFLTRMKNANHSAVRILLTGAGLPAAQRAINDAGVFRFLAKPCSSVAIRTAIREALALPRSDSREISSPDRATPVELGRYTVLSPDDAPVHLRRSR